MRWLGFTVSLGLAVELAYDEGSYLLVNSLASSNEEIHVDRIPPIER